MYLNIYLPSFWSGLSNFCKSLCAETVGGLYKNRKAWFLSCHVVKAHGRGHYWNMGSCSAQPPGTRPTPHGPLFPIKFMAFCFTYRLEWYITLWLIIRIRVSTKDQSARMCVVEKKPKLCV
jgi:hypothetical protein